MEEQNVQKKGFGFSKLLIAFVLGVLIVGTVILIPSYMGRGFLVIEEPVKLDANDNKDEETPIFTPEIQILDESINTSDKITGEECKVLDARLKKIEEKIDILLGITNEDIEFEFPVKGIIEPSGEEDPDNSLQIENPEIKATDPEKVEIEKNVDIIE